MKLIVGLGNPGDKYVNTRHNVGFQVLDTLADRLSVSWSSDKNINAEIIETHVGDEKIVLLKPQTFMNLSGDAVLAAAKRFNINVNDVWVVYDEATLDFGVLRIRKEGSAGGHNGIKSTIARLGADNFIRFRVGVGIPPEQFPLEDWVLSKFSKDETEKLDSIKTEVTHKIEDALKNGVESVTKKLGE